MSDFYEILGVAPEATAEQIKDRYRFLALAYHPDKFTSAGHKSQAGDFFKKINEAFETLKDSELRAAYDRQRALKSPPPQAASRDHSAPPQTPPPNWNAAILVGFVLALIAVFSLWRSSGSKAQISGGNSATPGATVKPPEPQAQRPFDPDAHLAALRRRNTTPAPTPAKSTPAPAPTTPITLDAYLNTRRASKILQGIKEAQKNGYSEKEVYDYLLQIIDFGTEKTSSLREIERLLQIAEQHEKDKPPSTPPLSEYQPPPAPPLSAVVKNAVESSISREHEKMEAVDWQSEAVKKYPALGVGGSSLHVAFFTQYRLKKETDPAFFNAPNWPLALADEVFNKSQEAKAPPPAPDHKKFFTIGSTKDEVLALQGTPESLTDSSFTYEYSRVYFKDGRVSSWSNIGKNLKVQLAPAP